MSTLPTGMVTFLFTNPEGSTLLQRLQEQYAALPVDERRIVRAVLEKWGDQEIDTQVYSFFVSSQRASVKGRSSESTLPNP